MRLRSRWCAPVLENVYICPIKVDEEDGEEERAGLAREEVWLPHCARRGGL